VEKSWHNIISGLALWCLAVIAGFGLLLHYKRIGGSSGQTPKTWPVASRIQKDPELPTLIMFVHPHCPCSRASVEELNRLLASAHQRVATQVWFSKPKEVAENWSRTGLWTSAAAMPGVAVHEDPAGTEADRFGAETSGYVVFYSREGRLLFQGGITSSRGHAGDNNGENAILAMLATRNTPINQTPVYGCSLLSPEYSKDLFDK
jgi:hypothetical protein